MAHFQVERLLGGPGNGALVPSEWRGRHEVWTELGEAVAVYESREHEVGGHTVAIWVNEVVPSGDSAAIARWFVGTTNDRMVSVQREFLKEAIGLASQYTTVIMVAGYAALFAFWSQSKGTFTTNTYLSVAVLLAISVIAFVGWELYGMFLRSTSMLGIAAAVGDREEFVDRLLKHNEKQALRSEKTMLPWALTSGLSAATGAAALIVMVCAFLHGLYLAV